MLNSDRLVAWMLMERQALEDASKLKRRCLGPNVGFGDGRCLSEAIKGSNFCYSHDRSRWKQCDVCGKAQVRSNPCRSCREWVSRIIIDRLDMKPSDRYYSKTYRREYDKYFGKADRINGDYALDNTSRFG